MIEQNYAKYPQGQLLDMATYTLKVLSEHMEALMIGDVDRLQDIHIMTEQFHRQISAYEAAHQAYEAAHRESPAYIREDEQHARREREYIEQGFMSHDQLPWNGQNPDY